MPRAAQARVAAVAANKHPPPPPPQQPPASPTTLALGFQNLFGDEDYDLEQLLRPPPRKRVVWGGAQSVERGDRKTLTLLHVGALPTPAKVYDSPVRPPSPSRGRAVMHGVLRFGVDFRRELVPPLAASASVGALPVHVAHDGLTPGQRHLGKISSKDRLAPHLHRQMLTGKPPSMPVLLPAASTRVLAHTLKSTSAALQARERLRRREYGKATKWIKTREAEDAVEWGLAPSLPFGPIATGDAALAPPPRGTSYEDAPPSSDPAVPRGAESGPSSCSTCSAWPPLGLGLGSGSATLPSLTTHVHAPLAGLQISSLSRSESLAKRHPASVAPRTASSVPVRHAEGAQTSA